MTTFKKGDLIGYNNVLQVVTPEIIKGDRHRRYYKTKCTICQAEQVSRYDVYKPEKGCPHNCHVNHSFVGKKFPTYEVLEHSGPSISGVQFKCRCICGKEFKKIAKLIRRTEKTGRGHGCGCKLSNGLPSTIKQGTLNRSLFHSYQRGATSRNLKFSLTQKQFDSLIQQPCHYCGVTQSNSFGNWTTYGALKCNGIDRKNNRKGYFPKNCVPCCKLCNRAKSSMSYDDFITWINHIKTTKAPYETT